MQNIAIRLLIDEQNKSFVSPTIAGSILVMLSCFPTLNG